MDQEGKDFFIHAYGNRQFWKGRESRSGPGSEGEHAKQKINIISQITDEFQVKTVLDIGCGDVFWMRDLFPKFVKYTGVDIVKEMILDNEQRFSVPDKIVFYNSDVTNKEMQAGFIWHYDLILCLDLFHHLHGREIYSIIYWLCPGYVGSLLLIKSHPGGTPFAWIDKSDRSSLVNINSYFDFCQVTPIKTWQGLNPVDSYELYRL